jgi:hypothetical protein
MFYNGSKGEKMAGVGIDFIRQLPAAQQVAVIQQMMDEGMSKAEVEALFARLSPQQQEEFRAKWAGAPLGGAAQQPITPIPASELSQYRAHPVTPIPVEEWETRAATRMGRAEGEAPRWTMFQPSQAHLLAQHARVEAYQGPRPIMGTPLGQAMAGIYEPPPEVRAAMQRGKELHAQMLPRMVQELQPQFEQVQHSVKWASQAWRMQGEINLVGQRAGGGVTIGDFRSFGPRQYERMVQSLAMRAGIYQEGASTAEMAQQLAQRGPVEVPATHPAVRGKAEQLGIYGEAAKQIYGTQDVEYMMHLASQGAGADQPLIPIKVSGIDPKRSQAAIAQSLELRNRYAKETLERGGPEAEAAWEMRSLGKGGYTAMELGERFISEGDSQRLAASIRDAAATVESMRDNLQPLADRGVQAGVQQIAQNVQQPPVSDGNETQRPDRSLMSRFLSEFSIGGGAIKAAVINRATTAQVSQWQQEAMPYQQSMLSFQLAMGMPYEEAMQGATGQIAAYQAAVNRFKTARGTAAMQGKIGMQQMLGMYPTAEMGELVGQIGSPLLSGLGAGLITGVGLTTLSGVLGSATGLMGGIGTFAGAAAGPAALAAGAIAGGGLALGQIYQAGSTPNLQREWSEIAMGQRENLSIWARMGEQWQTQMTEQEIDDATARRGAAVAQMYLPGGTRAPQRPTSAEGAAIVTTPPPEATEAVNQQATRLASKRREYEQSYAFRINNAAVYIENMKGLGLEQGQGLQVGGLLSMMGVTPEQITGNQADRYIRQFAPLMQLGQAEAQMSALMRFGGYLGIAPGRGLQDYAGVFPGVEQPAEQTRWTQAAQMLGGIASQAGITPLVSDVRRYADMMHDIPEAQLTALAREQYGLGGIGMALGAPAGFSSAFESLLRPEMQGMVGGRTATPGDLGGMPGMQIGGTPKYGPATLSADEYMKLQSLAQFGMSQTGYSLMAGGGPLAEMFNALGIGPGAPTGPALIGPQGYGINQLALRNIQWSQFGLQEQQQAATWEYQQSQQAFQLEGMDLRIGYQQELMDFTKELRSITHEMIAFQRERQARSVEFAERGLEMGTGQSLESLGMSRQMAMENVQYQRLQLGLQWGQMETRREWQVQDLSWQRQVSGFQYEYQQDELERAIRLATGREKQGLLRRREYQEEMYSMQESRRGVEEGRAKQAYDWEVQRFNLQKDHFERVTRLQQSQFAMQERHIMERYGLERQKIDEQKRAMQEVWLLEDAQRKLQEQWQDRQQQFELEQLERQREYYVQTVIPYEKQRHEAQVQALEYQHQQMRLQNQIEDAHAKYQAWQLKQYMPGSELYDRIMTFINEILAKLSGAEAEPAGTTTNPDPYSNPDPIAGGKKQTDLAEALFAGLHGANVKLVLDDGKAFNAHVEAVVDDRDFRRTQAGSWVTPWGGPIAED